MHPLPTSEEKKKPREWTTMTLRTSTARRLKVLAANSGHRIGDMITLVVDDYIAHYPEAYTPVSPAKHSTK